MPSYNILYDHEYTEKLNSHIRSKYGAKSQRNATHVSDLLYCLRKAWLKKQAGMAGEEDVDDDLLLTWAGGLMFEDIVQPGGDKQVRLAYCFHCRTVANPPTTLPDEPEADKCTICGKRWMVGTIDYVLNGIPYEVKQTRKSRRRGPEDAPWWVEQLMSYLLMLKRGHRTDSNWGGIVANWLMGDYGSRKKGEIPRPPRSALDAFQVVFEEGFEDEWETELSRRKSILEGPDLPALNGMAGLEDARSPAYHWECSSCPVGYAAGCEMFLWDADGRLEEGLVEEAHASED